MSINTKYYVPLSSWWPIIGGAVLAMIVMGLISWLHGGHWTAALLGSGLCGLVILLFGWLRDVIRESLSGLYSPQMDRTFRYGMLWFITSEIWFFGALFGALCYARFVSAPILGAAYGYLDSTKEFLYPSFVYQWPLLTNPDPALYPAAKSAIAPWGLPAWNTLVLLLSAGTLTMAHKLLLRGRSRLSALWLVGTVILGGAFLYLQYCEYHHAMTELNLLLSSGIYASTFYMITGFHGLHVLIGSIFLAIIAIRTAQGHFSSHNHFAFEAAAWYWHFVDTIWWVVFLFVYCV